MLTNLQAIFDYTCDRLQPGVIENYAPNDPGCYKHVHQLEKIRQSRTLPSECCFDVSFDWYSRVAHQRDAKRYLNYRIWLMSVGVHLNGLLQDSEVPWPTNYIALCMLNDIRDLGDDQLDAWLGDLADDVSETFSRWSYVDSESLFWIAAEMVWAHRRDDHQRTATVAVKLIEHESRVNLERSDRAKFLFGSTVYDHFHREWKDTLREITNPTQDEDLHLVLETLDLTNRRKLPYKR